MARFATMAGFGLLVCLDEMVNLYKLSQHPGPHANYEQILRILNDTLQGSAEYLGFLFGGTPDSSSTRAAACTPTRRCSAGWRRTPSPPADSSTSPAPSCGSPASPRRTSTTAPQPPPRLRRRRPGPTCCLTRRWTRSCGTAHRIGDAYFRTPRTTIKQFIGLMDVLVQNENADWPPSSPKWKS